MMTQYLSALLRNTGNPIRQHLEILSCPHPVPLQCRLFCQAFKSNPIPKNISNEDIAAQAVINAIIRTGKTVQPYLTPRPQGMGNIVFVCDQRKVEDVHEVKSSRKYEAVAEVQDVYNGLSRSRWVVGERDLGVAGAGKGTPFAEMRGEHGSEDGGGEGENLRGYNKTERERVQCEKKSNIAIGINDLGHGCGVWRSRSGLKDQTRGCTTPRTSDDLCIARSN